MQIRRPGTTSGSIFDFYYGFIDRTGALVIKPQFEHVTPFVKGRAWVAPQHTWLGSRVATKWAMIDRTGKVLTEWAYDPPEQDKRSLYPEDELLVSSRWRGDLVVLAQGQKLGLATAEGRVLVEPRFQLIYPFKNGLAAVAEWDGKESRFGFINERGEVVIPLEYQRVGEFDGDIVWACPAAGGSPSRLNAWVLLDRMGKRLKEDRYLAPFWARPLDPSGMPVFVGDLACVALVEGHDAHVENPAQRNTWGYIDRTGRRVVWHLGAGGKEPETPDRKK